jgi:hypothetical protein
MPERAATIADHIKAHVRWPHDLHVIDNGSDLAKPAKNTTIKLAVNCQTTMGWLAGLSDARSRHLDGYFAYMFIISSAEMLPHTGDLVTPLAQVLKDNDNAVGVHPCLSQDSTTTWQHLKNGGTGKPRRVWMIDNIASMYRADWWHSIGGFDPALYMAHGIDLETCWMARKHGRELYVHDGVEIKKVSNIGYAMGRMGMTAERRLELARANMDDVLGNRYGANYWYRLINEYRGEAW